MITEELKNKIIEEVEKLKDIDDCVGIKIDNNKGLFIQVVNYGDGKEYLIELNDIDEENNGWYPCEFPGYNAFSRFGDMKKLIKAIEEHLKLLNI